MLQKNFYVMSRFNCKSKELLFQNLQSSWDLAGPCLPNSLRSRACSVEPRSVKMPPWSAMLMGPVRDETIAWPKEVPGATMGYLQKFLE